MERKWDEQADVVVVGYGGAGAAAAIAAADRGASVLILEKQASESHTPSTMLSGGRVMGVTDVDRATRYLDQCASGMVPASVSRAWAERAFNLRSWLGELGLEFDVIGGAEQSDLEGADAIEVYADIEGKGGRGVFGKLAAAVQSRGSVGVVWSAPADRLIRNRTGRVTGVEVTTDSGRRKIGARKGVILTCGGYEHDEELKLNYLRAPNIHFYGNPGNTGDGVRMAQAIGADLWHMNQMIGRASTHFSTGDGTWSNFLVKMGPPGYIITDKYGNRFVNEYPQAIFKHGFYHELIGYDPEAHDYPRIPCYWLFDERRMSAGPLVFSGVVVGSANSGLANWSPDNQDEVERGWIKKGRTVEEAAELAGIKDPAGAARSVGEYNQACNEGRDRFGRPPDSLVPLDTPPFYCVPMYPGGPSTTGGPRRNANAEIVDPFGRPIPGLFGAGELGQATGLLCPSNGCNLSESFSFGQIAAKSAMSSGGRGRPAHS